MKNQKTLLIGWIITSERKEKKNQTNNFCFTTKMTTSMSFSKKNRPSQRKTNLTENLQNLSAWTQNNVWSQQDFDTCTWGDHPTLTATQGGPECDFLFSANANSVQRQLQLKIAELKGRKANGDEGLWMYLDSGASRSVISETSPLITHLYNLSETSGSCNVGNGATLKYLQKGMITSGNELTVVKDLQYDLYSAVAAAKRGVSCILD